MGSIPITRSTSTAAFTPAANAVLTVADVGAASIHRLLAGFGIEFRTVEAGSAIPGSYWGEPEAGLVRNTVYARADTPIHSVLHEAAHSLCMGEARRAHLDRDAGGDFAEEDAVCYLQVELADCLPGVGRERMFADMDAWGYTFRLGSARAWFEQDASDARRWLTERGLLAFSAAGATR